MRGVQNRKKTGGGGAGNSVLGRNSPIRKIGKVRIRLVPGHRGEIRIRFFRKSGKAASVGDVFSVLRDG